MVECGRVDGIQDRAYDANIQISIHTIRSCRGRNSSSQDVFGDVNGDI